MGMFKQAFQSIKSFFSNKTLTNAPTKSSRKVVITRAKQQKEKKRIKEGLTRAGGYREHSLNFAHFGTFSPVGKFRVNGRFIQ